MRNLVFITTLFISSLIFAQSKDYNLKKGYVAKGYDVVSSFDYKPTKGKKEFTTRYDGVKFKFSSSKNLKKFKNNPHKYIPQYGGWYAYAIGKTAKNTTSIQKPMKLKTENSTYFTMLGGLTPYQNGLKKTPNNSEKKADQNWETFK